MPWTELRSMVEPSFSGRTLIKHTDYLSNARIITSSAVGITEDQVLTADGDSITFDYLVIATGHAYSTPKSRDRRLEQFEQGKHSAFFPCLQCEISGQNWNYLYVSVLCFFVLIDN